jgi:hypothetical protein
MVAIDVGCLSLLVIGWTTIGNWFPMEYGVYVGSTTSCLGTRYTFPCT